MKKITLLFFLMIASLGFSQTQVTFKVDMTNYTGLGTGTVYVNGTFNGWAGSTNALTQEGTTNIWSGTFPIAPGQIEYKFTVNGWDAQENLTSGTPCTLTTSGFTNRVVVVGTTAMVLPTVCWQSCSACSATPSNTDVTFKVDMANYVGLGTGTVYVSGTFNGWSGTANPLTQEGTTSIWSAVVPVAPGTIEYKFQVNNWASDETLTAGSSCTVTNSGFTNRSLVVGSTAIVNPVVCWASCSACTTTPTVAPSLPIDFESTTVSYTFTDFDGGTATKIANPNASGINTSATVAKMIKGAGAIWAGSYLTMAAPIDFSVNKIFKVKVFSPRVGATLRLKVEGAAGVVPFETEVACTTANTWEELTFNYTAVSTTNVYTKLVFIFDLGTVGDGTANFTFLVDDVVLGAPTTPTLTQMSLPVTFDSTTVDYGLISFGGTDSTIVVDPTLSSNTVAKVIKGAGAETWAGTTITAAAQLGFSPAIPLTATDSKMNVRVWSPNAGIQVRLKVENHANNQQTLETEATTTVANGWQTLEFNFANPATGTAAFNPAFVYDKASIFFNFGVNGATAGVKTYYFDDVKFGAALGVNSFEALNVKMYPNPTSSQFTIEAANTIEHVSLYNVLGQEVVSKQNNSNSITLDITTLNSGVYVVKTTIDGISSTSRIVKK